MSNLPALLTEFSSKYPRCWRLVDEIRALRGSKYRNWPEYSFLPFAVCHDLFASAYSPLDGDKLVDAARLATLSAWRLTQGIYRFDSTLYAELFDMSIGPLPPQVLHRLPEWCIYIELNETWARGVFVHIEHNYRDGHEELRVLFDVSDGVCGLYPLGFELTGSLHDALEKNRLWHEKQLKKDGNERDPNFSNIAKQLTGIVSLVLYICSVNADLSGQPVKPAATRTKRGVRLFPATRMKVWEVGYRIGPMLARSAERGPQDEATSGLSVRPHVRRAHWHHYWTGSGQNRELILKWLSPILVNVEDPEQLAATIRPIPSA